MRYLTLALTYMVLTPFASAQTLDFARYIGGPAYDAINGVAVDAQGNSYSVGEFGSACNFDTGSGTVQFVSSGGSGFVAKHDPLGNLLWLRILDGTCEINPKVVALSGNSEMVVSGHFKGPLDADFGLGVSTILSTSVSLSHAFVLKLDTAGQLIWAEAFGNALVKDLHVDNDGEIYISGYVLSGGAVDLDPGPDTISVTSQSGQAAYISKFDPNGLLLWCNTFIPTAAASDVAALSLDVTSNEEVVVCGQFKGSADFDPGSGQYLASSINGYDAFVCKFDPSGTIMWCDRFGGTSTQAADEVEVNVLDQIIVGGQFKGTVDFDPGPNVHSIVAHAMGTTDKDGFVLQLNAAGGLNWVNSYGSGIYSNIIVGDLVEGDGTDFFVPGSFEDIVDFDNGVGNVNLNAANGAAFLLKLDVNGSFLSIAQFDTAQMLCAAYRSPGELTITGYHRNLFDLDLSPYPSFHLSMGEWDGLLMRLTESMSVGLPEPSRQVPQGILVDDNGLVQFPCDFPDPHVVVFDVLGRVESTSFIDQSHGQIELDLSKLTPGVHWIHVSDQRGGQPQIIHAFLP